MRDHAIFIASESPQHQAYCACGWMSRIVLAKELARALGKEHLDYTTQGPTVVYGSGIGDGEGK